MCFDDDYDAFDWHQLVNGLESVRRPCVLAMIIGNLRRKVKHWPYGVQVMGSLQQQQQLASREAKKMCNSTRVQQCRIRPFKPAMSAAKPAKRLDNRIDVQSVSY